MRLICPNCVAQYEVDEDVIPAEGRDVQCANCGHNWFQDAIEMLSSEAEATSGTGDPDSDVPAELFNDLEGKMDTAFVSKRGTTAPDPNDMEPGTPRDDFQIEQEPATPSSRMDQDALDILHEEAEYSSGEKPPAIATEPAVEDKTPESAPVEEPTPTATDDVPEVEVEVKIETEDTPETAADEAAQKPVEETSYIPVEDPTEEATEKPPAADEDDDLDEIRRRILDLEQQEGTLVAPETTDIKPSDISDLDIPDFEPEHTQAPRDNPFSRPTPSSSRTDTSPRPSTKPHDTDRFSSEESNAPVLGQDQSIENEIETLVAAQDIPDRASAISAFSADSDADILYGSTDKQPPKGPVRKRAESPKDMFPDVDELSSEIASEAEQAPDDHHPTAVSTAKKPSRGGFMKGFKYALLFYILIGALYLFQPVILQYIPQAEGFLGIITTLVDMLISLFGPLIEMIKGMLG